MVFQFLRYSVLVSGSSGRIWGSSWTDGSRTDGRSVERRMGLLDLSPEGPHEVGLLMSLSL
jgi:hypothetical protein